MKTRSSKTLKAHGFLASVGRYEPYSDTELLRLKQRVRGGAHANRTHVLRLLATIDRERESPATTARGHRLAQRERAMRLEFETTRPIQLAPAQARVLSELCRGRRTREIAKILGRSPATVYNHIRLLFTVFGVHNRAALVARAIREEVVDIGARRRSPRSRTDLDQ